MSLLSVLGLPIPTAVLKAPGAGAGGQVGARHGRPPAKKPVVHEGPVEIQRVKPAPLEKLRWERRYKGDLLAFVDASGAIVTGGPAVGWKNMATMNILGRRIAYVLADLDAMDRGWRSRAEAVKKGTAVGMALAEKARKAMGAISARKKNDAEFREGLREYFRQARALSVLALEVKAADADFQARLNHLGGVIKEGEIRKAEFYAKLKQAEIDALKVDIEQAGRVIGKLLSAAKLIVGFAVAPGVTTVMAMISEGAEFLSGPIVDGAYSSALVKLESELRAAQKKVDKLAVEQYAFWVNEARSDLAAAVERCKIADENFRNGVHELRYSRSTAEDESNEPATRVIRELMLAAAQQSSAIATLADEGRAYLELLAGLFDSVSKVTTTYRDVDKWIDDIARTDARLARGSAWAEVTNQVVASNAAILGRWQGFMPTLQAQCGEALAVTSEAGTKQAMAPFDEALASVDLALGRAA